MTFKISTLPRNELENVVEDVWSDVMTIQRELYLLMGDLEESLRESRGKVNGESVTLCFQRRGIDVTQWLAGSAWIHSADLVEKLDDLIRDVDDAPGHEAKKTEAMHP